MRRMTTDYLINFSIPLLPMAAPAARALCDQGVYQSCRLAVPKPPIMIVAKACSIDGTILLIMTF